MLNKLEIGKIYKLKDVPNNGKGINPEYIAVFGIKRAICHFYNMQTGKEWKGTKFDIIRMYEEYTK